MEDAPVAMSVEFMRIVLLIEDNIEDEKLAVRALGMSGLNLKVVVARDGEEALKVLDLEINDLETESCEPDLIVSDLKMPKVHGDQVLARVRADERLRETPYVMFSSSDEHKDIQRCMEVGASEYCRKPIDFDEYEACLKGMARRWLSA